MYALSFEAIREIENKVMSSGTSEAELIGRAGKAAAEILLEEYPQAKRFVFFCGKGNNGADGRVAAGLLPNSVIYECDWKIENFAIFPGDVVIDAIFGTGFAGVMQDPYAEVVNFINRLSAEVVSLDFPSGGKVIADLTIAFGYPKAEFFAPEISGGKLRLADIGLPPVESGEFEVTLLEDVRKMLAKIPQQSHKNSRGRVLLCTGSDKYRGAGVLSVTGALRGGAGLVASLSRSTPSSNMPAAAICQIGGTREIKKIIDNFDVVGAGSGWGSDDKNIKSLKVILQQGRKIVLDADALNIISRQPELWNLRQPENECVITPHPGEAARLCRAFKFSIAEAREKIALNLATKLKCTVIYKGRHTVVATPDGRYAVNSSGTADLATAGSGDVLCGLVTALLVNHPAYEAARIATFVHGRAAEFAHRGLIADDLGDLIYRTWRDFCS